MIKTRICYKLYLEIIIQILMVYKFYVFVYVSNNCEIVFIVENGVTKEQIIMFDDGDDIKNYLIVVIYQARFAEV